MRLLRIYSVKFIVLVVALQILNLSVYGNEYVQTIEMKNGSVRTEFNQIDSLIEYIMEILLKYENAFPEQRGNHTKNESKNFKAPFQFQLFSEYKKLKDEPVKSLANTKQYAFYSNGYDYLFFKEINPPPPKLH